MLTISIVGRLVADPEVKMIKSDLAVTKFRVVSNRYDGRAEDKRASDFVDCELWGKRGVTFAEYFSKGDGMVGHGSLQIETWQDKETGENRSKPLIALTDWEFPVERKAGSSVEQQEEAPF